jgi:hypothetical protein
MSSSEGGEAEQVPDRQDAIDALLAELGDYARRGICALADGRYDALPRLAEHLDALGRQLLGGRVPFSRARLEAVCRRLEQSRQGAKAKGAASQPKPSGPR